MKYWKHICFWYSNRFRNKICRKYRHYKTWLLSKAELIIAFEWSLDLCKEKKKITSLPSLQNTRNHFELFHFVLDFHFAYSSYHFRITTEKVGSKSHKSKSEQISSHCSTFLQNISLSTKAVSINVIYKRKMFSYQRKTGSKKPENTEFIQPSAL